MIALVDEYLNRRIYMYIYIYMYIDIYVIQWVRSAFGHQVGKSRSPPAALWMISTLRLRPFENTQVQVSHEEMKELPLTTNMQIFNIALGFLPVSPSSSDHKNHEESVLILAGNA